MDAFLNVERHAVSKAEREGLAHPTSEGANAFLRGAGKRDLAFTGVVYRGTTQAELAALERNGFNTTTWSVSKDPEGASHFAKKGKVLLVIERNSGAVPVDSIRGSNTFNEALIPRGTGFKQVGRKQVGDVTVVRLRKRRSHER